ncbi:MAG: CoA transferase [Gammaproteobacteria bacterium]|nr:MAG: CoA transferase [Gammaproteobacteria bacterium]
MNAQPLDGITVLDFGQVYNGPYCGFLLAQAGARVIKVESLIGETLRARGDASAASYAFAMLNANKESITLNIKSEEAQALVKQLAGEVDVVFENFAPGTMAKYGIGPEDLRKENPRLIYASSTGYGAVGPHRDFLGMDITLQAMTGVMSVTGEEGGPPLKTVAAFADFIAGTHLYAGIVSALLGRERTGEGATVDVSMQDCVFPTLATALGSYYVAGGVQQPRGGNHHPGRALAPYNVYEARDGHIAIICIREGHWKKLCAAMERPDLAEDPRYAKMDDRCANMEAVDELVSEWTRARTKAEIFAITQANGVICAPVQDLADVVNDEHMLSRGSLQKRPHPGFGETSQCQTPIRFIDIDPPTLTDPPALGADTDRVLGELAGLSGEALSALRDKGAI